MSPQPTIRAARTGGVLCRCTLLIAWITLALAALPFIDHAVRGYRSVLRFVAINGTRPIVASVMPSAEKNMNRSTPVAAEARISAALPSQSTRSMDMSLAPARRWPMPLAVVTTVFTPASPRSGLGGSGEIPGPELDARCPQGRGIAPGPALGREPAIRPAGQR